MEKGKKIEDVHANCPSQFCSSFGHRDDKCCVECVAPRRGFQQELEALLNQYSVENGSNTPDFILAQYMCQCLDAFTVASRAREEWYGISLQVGGPVALRK